MTNTANTLNFLFSLLYPPLRELFPFQQNNPNREIVRETLNRTLKGILQTHHYQYIALYEFNTGLYHMDWGEIRQAHNYFHKARFHSSLVNNTPFVCLAYFAEVCAHDYLYETTSALNLYGKARTSLTNFRGFLHTHHQGRRLTYFVRSLEEQMDEWRQALDETLRSRAIVTYPTTPLITDGQKIFQWFTIERPPKISQLQIQIAKGDWILAEINQRRDGSWQYNHVYIVGRNESVGIVPIQPYPSLPSDPNNSGWFLGQIREWVRDTITNEVQFRPMEPEQVNGLSPQTIQGIAITHFQKRNMDMHDLPYT